MYYVGIVVLALVLFARRRKRRGMSLHVHFNYNGHSWDAYEVLGLPAGSLREKVEDAYKQSLTKVDAGSRPFIEAAYKAIISQKN